MELQIHLKNELELTIQEHQEDPNLFDFKLNELVIHK